eukprot:4471511-Prymnesium_polylepis.1
MDGAVHAVRESSQELVGPHARVPVLLIGEREELLELGFAVCLAACWNRLLEEVQSPACDCPAHSRAGRRNEHILAGDAHVPALRQLHRRRVQTPTHGLA